MDPLSVARSVSSVIALALVGLRTAAKLRKISNSVYLSSPTESALRKYNGAFAIWILKWFLPDTLEQLERIDQTVLPGRDEVVLAFKNSYISDCTQTAVAVSFSGVQNELHDMTAIVNETRALLLLRLLSLHFRCLILVKHIGSLGPSSFLVLSLDFYLYILRSSCDEPSGLCTKSLM